MSLRGVLHDHDISRLGTLSFDELAAAVRGELILPGAPGYDEARAVYNGMVDKHPAVIVRCRDVADVISLRRLRPGARRRDRRPRRRPQRGRAGRRGRGPGHRPVPVAQHDRRPGRPHRAGRRRLHLGGRGSRHRRVRHGHPVGLHRLHRRGRPDPGRRHRVPVPPLRPHRGQPDRPPTWCSPTGRSSPPARTPTPTCSGRCAAAAATSASSPRSPSAATTSASRARSSAARSCTTSTTPPR